MLKKRLIFALKILFALAIFGGVAWALYKSWDKIQGIHWEPNYHLLVLAGICYVVAYIPAAIFWRYAMRTLGQQPGVYESFRAYYIGHLGKYIPGKGFVLVIRSGLLNHKRTKISAAVASVFLETMTMMAVGAFVTATIVMFWFRQEGHNIEHENWIMLLTVGVMCGTMLPIFPPVFHFIAKKCRIALEGLRFRTLAVGWILNIPVWIMLGVSLWLIMQGVGIQSQSVFHDVLFCILTVSAAMVFGFATPIPGGLGARELAALYLLVPFFLAHPNMIGDNDPVAMAIVIVFLQRIIAILSELILSVPLFYIRRS